MAGPARWAQQLGMSLSLLTDNRAETLAGPLPAKWCIKDRTEAALTGPCHLRTRRSSGFRSEIRGLEWLPGEATAAGAFEDARLHERPCGARRLNGRSGDHRIERPDRI
jgi:hypothetical protein